jgi:hypothetical protein
VHGLEPERMQDHEFEGSREEVALIGTSRHDITLILNTYFENSIFTNIDILCKRPQGTRAT